jgi:hypothetical protein
LRRKIHQQIFRPKWCFVESIPGRRKVAPGFLEKVCVVVHVQDAEALAPLDRLQVCIFEDHDETLFLKYIAALKRLTTGVTRRFGQKVAQKLRPTKCKLFAKEIWRKIFFFSLKKAVKISAY